MAALASRLEFATRVGVTRWGRAGPNQLALLGSATNRHITLTFDDTGDTGNLILSATGAGKDVETLSIPVYRSYSSSTGASVLRTWDYYYGPEATSVLNLFESASAQADRAAALPASPALGNQAHAMEDGGRQL